MCGISGVFEYRSGEAPSRERLERMNESLVHRGPDDGRVFLDGPVGLAHRRLSIIDVEGSPQPFCSEDGERCLVFNGEIYEFESLRRRLEERGHRFRSSGDTEVVLAAYEEYGPECVDHLRGMFAFAIWDRPKRRLFLARDRLGIKPLYVFDDGERIVFGSEIKAILAHGDLGVSLDPSAVADYFSFLYVPAPKSIFKQVRKLRPGHRMIVESDSAPRVERYWEIRFAPDGSRSPESFAQELRERLDRAVAMRMVSDVPLGAFLSGGIDSSAVVSSMAAGSDSPIKTFAIGFDAEGFDERPYARQVAERYGCEHEEFSVRPDAMDVVTTLGHHFDEPFADSSAVPTWFVCKMARSQVTVALSGDGGDESFAGYYRRYLFERNEHRLRQKLPSWFRRWLLRPLALMYPKADWLPRPLRAKTVLTNLALSAPEAFFNTMALCDERTRDALFAPGLRDSIKGYRSVDHFRQMMGRCQSDDPVSRAQFVDMHSFMVDDILTKVDRASMAVSLEVRVPLIDHEFMEFTATIPSDLKLRGGSGKWIFKEALRSRLGPEILDRKKKGFEIPIGSWFKADIKDYAREQILGGGPLDELFDTQRVEKIWDEHQSGLRDWTHMLWAFLMFRQWARKWAP